MTNVLLKQTGTNDINWYVLLRKHIFSQSISQTMIVGFYAYGLLTLLSSQFQFVGPMFLRETIFVHAQTNLVYQMVAVLWDPRDALTKEDVCHKGNIFHQNNIIR